MKLLFRSSLPYWQTLTLILTAGWAIIFIYRTLLVPIYPVISQYFGGVTNAQLGYISSCYFFGYVCMQIPSGILVDKVGRKQILIPSFFIFSIGAATITLSSTMFMVYIGSVIAGIGCGTFYGVAYSFTAQYVPVSKRSLTTAIINSGIAIGSSFGLISSSFLVNSGFLSWKYLIIILIILIFIMMFIFHRFILSEIKLSNEVASFETKNTIQSKKTLNKLESRDISFLYLLCRPQMIAAYILYFSTLYTYYLIDTWLPNFLEIEKGVKATSVGLMSSLAFFSAIPGALFFSYVADMFLEKKIQIIIFLEILAVLCLFMGVYSVNTTVIAISIIAYGFFGKLAVEPIIIAWIGQFASLKNLATTYGIFNFFGMSSAVIVPSLTGYISDIMHSKSYAFYLAIAITLTGTLIFYLITKANDDLKKV